VEEPFLSAIECTWGNEFWQTETHTAEALVTEQNVFGSELAAEKLKRHK
jgi:hypothetical protein